MFKALALAAAVLAGAAATSAQAATILAAPDSACAKSGCLGDGHVWSRTFSAGGASGPVTISDLQLFKSLLGDLQDNRIRISFQLADGTVLGDWGAFVVAALGGEAVTLGGQAFTWDPSKGDLILRIEAVVPAKGGAAGLGVLAASLGGSPSSGGAAMSLFQPDAPVGSVGDVAPPPFPVKAVLTGLPGSGVPLAAAPEPSTWALVLVGFAFGGAWIRRNRGACAFLHG